MIYHRPSMSTQFSLHPVNPKSHQNNMNGACVYEEKTVIHELTQAIQMAKQLMINLHSPEARHVLIQKILSSYENALFVLQSGNPNPTLQAAGLPESSSMFTRSSPSEVIEFNQPFSIQQEQNVIPKKRKASQISEDQVIICSDNGLEDNTNDGYNWRKYGQKHISGSNFPRSYYRCSYRKVQKCFATKHVQRTNENPKVFEIGYKGKHTCNHGARLTSSSSSPSPSSPPHSLEKHEITPTHQLTPPLTNSDEMFSDLRAILSDDTLDLGGDQTVQSSFSFPSNSFRFMDDLQQIDVSDYYDKGLWRVDSPRFISPSTSESDFFTEWGSSSSLDLLVGPADVDPGFEFMKSLF